MRIICDKKNDNIWLLDERYIKKNDRLNINKLKPVNYPFTCHLSLN